jgi:molybdate transport system substrate-binding protein
VRVAAAADLRHALEEVIAAFRAEHAGTSVTVTYGASGALFSQIEGGAPYDLFFSADERFPQRLADAGRAVVESVTTYAVGHLVLWAPAGSPVEPAAGLAGLRDPRVQRIAIANPAHAPYGRAAEAALRAAGVHDAVKDRLVVAENVSQAAQFAESGNADAALLPLSLALAPALANAGRHALVPASLYPPLRQAAAVTAHGRGNVAAAALLRFVVAREGRAILERWGFGPPER